MTEDYKKIRNALRNGIFNSKMTEEELKLIYSYLKSMKLERIIERREYYITSYRNLNSLAIISDDKIPLFLLYILFKELVITDNKRRAYDIIYDQKEFRDFISRNFPNIENAVVLSYLTHVTLDSKYLPYLPRKIRKRTDNIEIDLTAEGIIMEKIPGNIGFIARLIFYNAVEDPYLHKAKD